MDEVTSRVPNTFIVGAPKSGTTALADFLGQHPQAFFSTPKEPFFWSDDIARSKHELRPNSLSEYLALFSGAKPSTVAIGEGSTRYLRSTVAVERILAFNPQSRFIAMLRNPMEAAPAFHMEQRYVAQESVASFDEAWRVQPMRERGKRLPKNDPCGHYTLYRHVYDYPTQIARLYRTVPADQVKVILFDDFKADPEATYESTARFLELDDSFEPDFRIVNGAHAQRFPALSAFLLHPPDFLARSLRTARSQLMKKDNELSRRVKRFMNVERDRTPPSQETREAMVDHFEPQIARLSGLLNRDLSTWLEP